MFIIVSTRGTLTLPLCSSNFPRPYIIWRSTPNHFLNIRDLKQTRTATAVNKQLNFTVKNKPHTTNYIYYIFEAYFMIKSVWKNCIDCFEVNLKWHLSPRRRFAVLLKTWKLGFPRLQHDGNLLGVCKRYSRMTSKQSIQFFHTLLIIKYASNMQYI